MSELKEATYELLDALEEQARFRLITRVFDESRPMGVKQLVGSRGQVCLVGAAIPDECQAEFVRKLSLGINKRAVLIQTGKDDWTKHTIEATAEQEWDHLARQGIKQARAQLQEIILQYIEDQGGI